MKPCAVRKSCFDLGHALSFFHFPYYPISHLLKPKRTVPVRTLWVLMVYLSICLWYDRYCVINLTMFICMDVLLQQCIFHQIVHIVHFIRCVWSKQRLFYFILVGDLQNEYKQLLYNGWKRMVCSCIWLVHSSKCVLKYSVLPSDWLVKANWMHTC
jgi:hypothetical protein